MTDDNTKQELTPSVSSAPTDVANIYEVLAPMAGNYMNAQAEQIGQAQKTMGPLAANTMGSTTAGLGNYTYNRLMRPQVDTMRDEILVQGYANQLNRLLSDALNKARSNYNKKSGGSAANDDSNSNAWNGEIEREELDSTQVDKHENKSNYQLMWVIDPSGNRTQWKYTQGELFFPGGYDNPSFSYDFIDGTKTLQDLVRNGYKITDDAGNDITSRYK